MTTTRDPQETWDEYYERIRSRRAAEARAMIQEMNAAGVTSETILALDFVHFSPLEKDARSLADQLAENYEVRVEKEPSHDYWRILGTTRPYGIELDESEHAEWVGFMTDVARSHACVFSFWEIEDPGNRQKWSSQNYDA